MGIFKLTRGKAVSAKRGRSDLNTITSTTLIIQAYAFIVIAAAPAGQVLADGPAPGRGQGWTGITKPRDLIEAREALMIEIEELMEPIDTYTVDNTVSPGAVTDAADKIAAMLLAVPHLFPPTTNLYDPGAEQPETLALPGIWKDFPVFYKMAAAASQSATALAGTTDPTALRTGALNLRESCDACHALFLRPYQAPEVTDEDRNFDFNSVFNKKGAGDK